MILDGVQSSDGQHDQRAWGMICLCGADAFWMGGGSHAAEHDFGGINAGVMLQQVPAVEFGDGHAEFAVGQLGIEVGRVQQEIGTMQRHAKADSGQFCRDHGDPRGEVTVVHVNVLHAPAAQLQGEAGAEPGMQDSAETLAWRFVATEENAPGQAREQAKSAQAKARSTQQQAQAKRLQIQSFSGEALQVSVEVGDGLARTAEHDLDGAFAEFLNFLDHVGLNRRRKLVGQIGDGGYRNVTHGAPLSPKRDSGRREFRRR